MAKTEYGTVDLVRLSSLMRRKGLGPTELANKAGIAPAAVTRIFRGADARGSTLAKIAHALNASVDYLLGGGQTPDIEDHDVDQTLDRILSDYYGYDHNQIEALRRQIETFSPKQRDFLRGDELAAALGAAVG